VAHLRLDWWRGEAERFARGEPQHPWLRALLAQHPASRGLDLQPLVQAAALDLATQTLGAPSGVALPGAKLQRAVFELAADALRPDRHTDPLPPQLQRTLRGLGERVLELERFAAGGAATVSAPAAPAAALEALRRQAAAIDAALAAAARAAAGVERTGRRPGAAPRAPPGPNRGSMFDGFADNMLAWSAARRAVRGRIRID
jgi:hypothetical protein